MYQSSPRKCPDTVSARVNDACVCLLPFQVFDAVQNLCVCQPNYVLDGSTCVQCPPDSYKLSPTQCQCLVIGQSYVGGACSCAAGYFLRSQQCVQCPPGATSNPTSCTCASAGTVYNATANACDCQPNFMMSNSACRACPAGSARTAAQASCVCSDPNTAFDFAQFACVCVDNFWLSGASCVSCPPGAYKSGSSCACLSSALQFLPA